MAKVTLKNVYKTYKGERGRDVVAVDNFNLEVNDREFIVFVGPSGCGKSTTLRMIAGLEEISRGDISIDDRRVNDVPPKDRDIAMVFQNYALYPHMSVYDNLAFGLKLRGVSPAEIKKSVGEAAAILGIENYLDRKPKALSGGQRQRVALGRAIVRQPKVFLFDEPLSNLDAKMRVQMRAEIMKLHRQLKSTMIYVTHDQVEAMTMGDRIVVMQDGKIQQIDAPLKLYHEPANLFVAGFLGSPPINIVRGTLQGAVGKMIFREAGGPIELKWPGSPALASKVGQEIILGLRAEDLSISTDPSGGDNRFTATIEFVESTGADANIHLQTGGHAMISRTQVCNPSFTTGQRADFAVENAKAHFFDPQTTLRLA